LYYTYSYISHHMYIITACVALLRSKQLPLSKHSKSRGGHACIRFVCQQIRPVSVY